MKYFTVIITILFCTFSLQGLTQEPTQKKKIETIEIKTSAVCGMCKNKIESALIKTKGVKNATLDLEDKTVMIKYQPTLTTPVDLRHAISALGYDADEIPANPEAYRNLHFCCKKE